MNSRLGLNQPVRATRLARAIATSVVRRARQAHVARAICGAVACLLLVVGLALNGGSGLGDVQVHLLGVFTGGLALVAWLHSVDLDRGAIVERIDRRLRLGGGFIAACENGESESLRPVAELDACRVLERTPRTAAREAAVPHVVAFLALPLGALAVLIQGIEHRDQLAALGQQAIGQMRVVTDGVQDMLAQASGDISAKEAAGLQAALAAAKEATDEEARGAAMREVADQLDQLADGLREDSPLAAAAEQLAFSAEVAAIDEAAAIDEKGPQDQAPSEPDLSATADSPGEEGVSPERSADVAEEGGSPGPGTTGDEVPSGGLTDEAGELGAPDATSTPPGAATPASGSPGPGTTPAPKESALDPRSARATRWWRASEAPIVEGWLAIVRGRR